MTDTFATLTTLRRPRLLISAARFGLADYRRERDLRRVTQAATMPTPQRALAILVQQEESLEETRKSGDAAYSIARHIEVLVAMMAEARLVPRAQVA